MTSRRAADTLEHFNVGVALRRARFRREHPHATEKEIAALVRAWLIRDVEPPTGLRRSRRDFGIG